MLESGTSKVTLTVTSLEGTKSNVTVSEDQILNPVDVHVSGVAAGNTTPITVTVKALLKSGLNSGNHQLYHVENGVTNAMTAVATEAELTAHNTYYYDPATGDVTMALCSFSEITTVQNRTSTWAGGVDHSWYDADAAGYTVPESDKFHATSCTVHFGDWNNYYYCELVANSLASYTHDHQMSRLTQVKSVSGTTITPLEGEAFTVPSSGRYNYVVVNGTHGTENATCYHFVDGKVWNHTDAGKETVGGAEVDKEDKQHIYLPFKQLLTGYGWGVKHIPIYENNSGLESPFKGVTILDRITPSSTQKFEVVGNSANDIISVKSGTPIQISDLFEVMSGYEDKINSAGVYVSAEKFDLYSKVSGEFIPTNTDNWAEGTITFSGTGILVVGIQDYDYCTPTYRFVEVYNQPDDVEYFYSPVMMAQHPDMCYQGTLSLVSDEGFDYVRIQPSTEAGAELHFADWHDNTNNVDYNGNCITLTTDGSKEYYVVVKVRASAADSTNTTPNQLGIHYYLDGANTASELKYANVTKAIATNEWVTLAMKLEILADNIAHQLTMLKLTLSSYQYVRSTTPRQVTWEP